MTVGEIGWFTAGFHTKEYLPRYEDWIRKFELETKAKLGRLSIEPGSDARNYDPKGKIPQVDWLTMASIRDSENWLFCCPCWRWR